MCILFEDTKIIVNSLTDFLAAHTKKERKYCIIILLYILIYIVNFLLAN